MGRSKSSQETKIPEWLQAAAQGNIARADQIGSIGYMPYYGPDVAAFTPMQQAAFQNTANAAGAFGMAAPAGANVTGMPAPQTFAGGVQGYSSGSLYDAALAELQRRNPGQFAGLMQAVMQPGAVAMPMPMPVGAEERRVVGGGGGDRGAAGSGVRPTSSGSVISSRLPGGVNTRNPGSFFNQTVARMTTTPTKVSSASRPKARPGR